MNCQSYLSTLKKCKVKHHATHQECCNDFSLRTLIVTVYTTSRYNKPSKHSGNQFELNYVCTCYIRGTCRKPVPQCTWLSYVHVWVSLTLTNLNSIALESMIKTTLTYKVLRYSLLILSFSNFDFTSLVLRFNWTRWNYSCKTFWL